LEKLRNTGLELVCYFGAWILEFGEDVGGEWQNGGRNSANVKPKIETIFEVLMISNSPNK